MELLFHTSVNRHCKTTDVSV